VRYHDDRAGSDGGALEGLGVEIIRRRNRIGFPSQCEGKPSRFRATFRGCPLFAVNGPKVDIWHLARTPEIRYARQSRRREQEAGSHAGSALRKSGRRP
jgi:hypothetical protein